MKQIKYLTFCRFILYLYKHAIENNWLEWFTKRFSRWIICIQDVCNISYVPKSFLYMGKNIKRQRKTDYVSKLYSNLNYVNFKGLFSHPCVFITSVFITMLFKNRKLSPKSKWLNKLWFNPWMEAAQ